MIWKTIDHLLQQRRNRSEVYSTAAYWDSKARDLKGSSVSMWINQSLNTLYEKEQSKAISRVQSGVAGLSILDLGCGTGRMTKHFCNLGAEVVGIDFSSAAIEIASNHSESQKCVFRCQSVFELEDVAVYDMVFSWGVMAIACRDRSELAEVLARVRTALKSDGVLLLLEPIHGNFLHRVLNMGKREFAEVVTSMGFSITHQTSLHFWPARILLSYLNIPMFLTWPVFQIGRLLSSLPGFRQLGDYTLIRAEVKTVLS